MSTAQAKPSSSRQRRDKDDTNNPDINITSIGNYAFQKTVGEGNFAKVKLAKHKLTGAEVAVKVIDKTTLDEKKLSKLYREVRIMKMLHHPNIVKLYEVIETRHTVFLVMEYASGGELYDYLVVHGKMKEKEARAKFRQILSAVSYCHKKRVIHRDLKAENLLLDANLDIKIADFGFSNYYDPDAKLDTFCGSPPYAAPELFQGRRYTGPEVDVWSLGVILYVLTTGCLPFDGKNLQEMRESVCRGKYRIPFYLSDTGEKLLRKFLIRDPFKRAGLEMLIDDPWINEGYTDSPIVGDISQKVEEDENIIRLIEIKYKVDRETIIHSLRENVYDDIAAIYYLLYYERATRDMVAAEVAALSSPTTVIHAPAPKAGAGNSSNADKSDLKAIGEDDILPPSDEGLLPAARPRPVANQSGKAGGAGAAAPRKRRFTVGGEADVAKLADEDGTPEAAEALKKLQNANVGATTGSSASRESASSTRTSPQSASGQQRPLSSIGEPRVPTEPTSASIGGTNAQVSTSTLRSGTDGGPASRKRGATVVGFFSAMRRPSEVAGLAASPSNSNNPNEPNIASEDEVEESSATMTSAKPGDENKPRSLRFTFNSNTTSSRPPDEIVAEVSEACVKQGATVQRTGRFLVECTVPLPQGGTTTSGGREVIKFEIEICKLPRLKNLHGLRFRRISGSSSDYKDICEKVLASVQL
ncbi:hypothetical protein SeMB42_g05552 [Synchytrium endobioticum]|uniref:non-specific serine/threonine protein kinase n=1 Tax=Synchytrium endobioticum TaxID=286115 RepID=A0A507CQT1_9FUNG|nr:hypothetical protein SeMB42_g05552 [Synchytrium endobioticum]TPX42646.1 hypothetical protein SeLEV6574_g05486 [Synchytrium endobioticum]